MRLRLLVMYGKMAIIAFGLGGALAALAYLGVPSSNPLPIKKVAYGEAICTPDQSYCEDH